MLDSKGKVVAVMQAINKKTTTEFTLEDVSLMESLARSAGIILRKAQLYQQAIFAEKRSSALFALIKSSYSHVPFDQLVNQIVEIARNILSADR